MNLIHRLLCRSDGWARDVHTHLMPWALEGTSLDTDVLELGPGPGRTTEWLAGRCRHLTALEIDPEAVDALRGRLGDRVEATLGDATAMPYADRTFGVVLSFTMLHHVPSADAQDRLFAEAFRVLHPGGVLVGSDGLLTPRFRFIHLFDTLVPVDPATLPARLESAGFTDVHVDTGGSRLRFRAVRPGSPGGDIG